MMFNWNSAGGQFVRAMAPGGSGGGGGGGGRKWKKGGYDWLKREVWVVSVSKSEENPENTKSVL